MNLFLPIICIVFVKCLLVEASHNYGDLKYCVDIDPAEDFDIDADVVGMWYAHEIILHNDLVTKTEYRNVCPLLHIKNIENPSTTTPRYRLGTVETGYYSNSYGMDPRYRHLTLNWEEPGNYRTYHVRFNYSRPGFWISSAASNVYLEKEYNHFAGTVQVLKAVRDHLVLSFCQRLPHSALFSVILSRTPHRLHEPDISSLHRLLDIKNLSTASLKRVCNSSSNLHWSFTLIGFTSLIIYLVKDFC